MAERVRRSAPATDPIVMSNWFTVDAARVPPKDDNALRTSLGLKDHLVVLYSGNLGLAHDLSILIEAAVRLRDEERLKFVIISSGVQVDDLRAFALDRGVARLFLFLPYQPAETLPISMGLGDISVVTVAAGAETMLFPCKTYDYMAAASAILAIVTQPSDLADLVESHACGVIVSPSDVDGVVRMLKRALAEPLWLRQMQTASQIAALEEFAPEKCCGALAHLVESLAPNDVPI
jgi:glycosyltransferase involved in cell wall biosynthesis